MKFFDVSFEEILEKARDRICFAIESFIDNEE